MNIRKSLTSSLICLVVVLLLGVVTFADTIRLKDGSVLKGKVVSYTQRKFTIIVVIGGSSSQHVIPVEEVEGIEFDSTDVLSSTRAAAGGPSSTDSTASRSEPSVLDPVPSGRAAKEPINTPPTNDLPPAESEAGSSSASAEKTVSVAAAADWTSTEIRVQRGQRIVVNATGEVELGNSRRCGPNGLSLSDSRKLIPNRPTGALIAVIGDDNDDFIYVGQGSEFVAGHNGVLFLSVNEGNLKDNSGAFVARVKVFGGK